MTEAVARASRILDEVVELSERLYALADEEAWEAMLGLSRERHERLERLAETGAVGTSPAIAKRLLALQRRDEELARCCDRQRNELAERIGELGHSEQALHSYGMHSDAGP